MRKSAAMRMRECPLFRRYEGEADISRQLRAYGSTNLNRRKKKLRHADTGAVSCALPPVGSRRARESPAAATLKLMQPHMKLWLAPEAPLVDSRRRNPPTVKAS
jgi:hypothetical protein